MEKGKKDSGLYACISDPLSVRRALLGSSKALIQSLQGYERIKGIRHEKARAISEFKKLVRETDELLLNVKKELPEMDISLERHKMPVAKKPEAPKPVHAKKAEEKQPVGEIDRLEKELSDIESKLSGLH